MARGSSHSGKPGGRCLPHGPYSYVRPARQVIPLQASARGGQVPNFAFAWCWDLTPNFGAYQPRLVERIPVPGPEVGKGSLA